MASGFTKIINESFDSYVKRLTESEDRCTPEAIRDWFYDHETALDDIEQQMHRSIEEIPVRKIKLWIAEHGGQLQSDFEAFFDCDLEEAYTAHRRRSMREAAPRKTSAEHKWGDKSVKSQLALPENQKKLNDMMKSGRNWRDMKNDFVQLIQSLDCTDQNKKQTIMKINNIRNESAFYSTVATYLTGIKAESLRKNESIKSRQRKRRVNESLVQRNRNHSKQNIRTKKKVK